LCCTSSSLCRFIDISRDQKLHLWKTDSAEISFSSLVSAICSCASDRITKGTPMASSWLAAGLSSGYCRLLDKRSGNIIAVWRAHDGHITKVSAPRALYHRCYKEPCFLLTFSDLFSLSHLCLQLAAPDDHLIVSSSLDKTLRVWDIRGYYSLKCLFWIACISSGSHAFSLRICTKFLNVYCWKM